MRDVRRHVRFLVVIVGLLVMSTAISLYILDHQRLRFPWEDTMRIEAEFASAQSVTPGQGQTVVVAGVQVGDITKVTLEEGKAVVEMELEPDKLGPVPLYRNASMLLRPKTGLNDMMVQLDPGTPDRSLPDRGRLRDGDRLPGANTLPNVNPDEVLSALDTDTRDYLAVLANAGGRGLRDQGDELREVLRASQPTFARAARVTGALADRRAKVRRLVTNLRRLSTATAAKDDELASLVDASAAVLETLGRRERELRGSVRRLPGALGAARSALDEAAGLSDELRPALERLRPSARELAPALRGVRPLARDATPVLRTQVRPLVREARPLLRDLRPSVADLADATPDLVPTGKVLNYIANELAYNPDGPEEGYLFWASWFFHNANAILSIEDAHGATWRGLVVVSCSTFGQLFHQIPALQPLAEQPACGEANN